MAKPQTSHPGNGTTPTAIARKARSLVNKARHAGIDFDPQATVDEILADITEQAEYAEEGVERAKVHSLRLAAADLKARLLTKAVPVVEHTPEELTREAVAYLEGQGWTCTAPKGKERR